MQKRKIATKKEKKAKGKTEEWVPKNRSFFDKSAIIYKIFQTNSSFHSK